MFFPSPENMYATDHSAWVDEDGALSGSLCGARRPGHFRGVCTVVAKLFNLSRPHLAVFGRKDFQQAAIIRRMVRDLDFGIDIVVAPIVREASGLAMSSRNTYLSDAERESALALSRLLKTVKAGTWAPQARRIRQALEQAGLKPDYVEAVDSDTLKPVKTVVDGVTVLLAAYSGKTRLIDNAEFTGGRMVL
jgi:pantoate--beta-alanine ligase